MSGETERIIAFTIGVIFAIKTGKEVFELYINSKMQSAPDIGGVSNISIRGNNVVVNVNEASNHQHTGDNLDELLNQLNSSPHSPSPHSPHSSHEDLITTFAKNSDLDINTELVESDSSQVYVEGGVSDNDGGGVSDNDCGGVSDIKDEPM
jgi:hypothetical protein